MFDLRPVFFVTGVLLSLLAVAMCVPAAVDAVHDNADWLVFLGSAAVTLFFGLALIAANWVRRATFSVRQIFLLTALGWFAVSLAGALPFAFSGLHLSWADAVFEAVSGATATGATVIRGLDAQPPGILLWRALMQWLGSAGFLVMAVVVLPAVNIGGMEMFRLESTGMGDRGLPRAAKVTAGLLAIYAAFTLLLTILLAAAGMSRFPAMLHAMSTISCGGFSTSDGSVGSWSTPAVQWVILGGMLLGGAPFVIYLQLIQRRWRTALRNTQLHWYLGVFAAAALAIALWLLLTKGGKPLPSIRHGLFTAASVMTGTGYATLDYGSWTGLPVAILFFLSFVGGCAGSAAGGLKVFRFQILFSTARVQLVRLLRPHAVLLPTFEHKQIPERVAESVLGFLFVYTLSFAVVAMALGMLGLEFMPALSVAASALANLGPGFTASVGPLAGYASLPDAAKWLLSATMLFGRAEMFVFLVLFSPSFWKP